eukprot:Protomagalhaensia_wolfi_Nauph_80__3309@NODE_3366_length_815_cov_26_971649_g2642_i0_p1_GENE_NODE_3366_length_815_cov_26_971649_g2642_i0NODE_3366_length_815_cov_26_971649_g2642_i0_p1_ORF_typecomplete_len102_score3_65C2/PF00168_30/0_21_NODE_3366_length_815_cov_26_971649_g2642_i0138443
MQPFHNPHNGCAGVPVGHVVQAVPVNVRPSSNPHHYIGRRILVTVVSAYNMPRKASLLDILDPYIHLQLGGKLTYPSTFRDKNVSRAKTKNNDQIRCRLRG